MISLIAALGKGGEIGLRGQIPWHISEDLKNFKKITLHHCIAMGRKTFESLGQCLPGRTSIVLTRGQGYLPDGALRAKSVDEVLSLGQEQGETELFVVGGAQVYRDFFPLVERMYLSRVDYKGPADTYFPAIDLSLWKSRGREVHGGVGKSPAWVFEILERISPTPNSQGDIFGKLSPKGK